MQSVQLVKRNHFLVLPLREFLLQFDPRLLVLPVETTHHDPNHHEKANKNSNSDRYFYNVVLKKHRTIHFKHQVIILEAKFIVMLKAIGFNFQISRILVSCVPIFGRANHRRLNFVEFIKLQLVFNSNIKILAN